MSIVARSVVYDGWEMSRPSCMYCVNVVRSVVVECKALKSCCVCERGMFGLVVFRISLPRILTGLHNN